MPLLEAIPVFWHVHEQGGTLSICLLLLYIDTLNPHCATLQSLPATTGQKLAMDLHAFKNSASRTPLPVFQHVHKEGWTLGIPHSIEPAS